MELSFKTDIKFLKGVGEKRAKLYSKLSVHNIGDLICYYPREYIDATTDYDISTAPKEESIALRLTVSKKGKEQHIRKGMSIFKVMAFDESGDITITFFNSKYTVEALKEGEEYLFYGKITGSLLKKDMNSPIVLGQGNYMGMIPIYSLTAGLSSKMISANIKQALQQLGEKIPDILPLHIRQKYGLCHMEYAIRNIHFPNDKESGAISRERLIFQELFTISIALSSIKKKDYAIYIKPMKNVDISTYYNSLPFAPTGGQISAINDIILDLLKTTPMNRLVQGDVGCGKTAVGAAAAYFAYKNNTQTAMMAPTEILATQHYDTMEKFLTPLGVKTALLTGSNTAKEKREIKKQLLNGEIDLCIGTHALITGDVQFKDLGLVITDEQHRFGVAQRTALALKGEGVHTLVMSATPIPRTLALIVYGDLDISQIIEMPVGRTPIKTYQIDSTKRKRAYNYIRGYLDRGFQGYIVCPAVEMGEIDMGLKTATEYAKDIKENEFSNYTVGLIHGKLKPKDKEQVMQDFKNGHIQLLVSTTVIEVGVDVPNSVIMLIENADRFGMSQLHQLRGRVGRGKEPSSCILLSDAKGEEALRRLSTMCKTTNGFEIAAEDLKLRGAGDFFGHRQHGLPQLKLADMSKDILLLHNAQESAKEILSCDPSLTYIEHKGIKKQVEKLLKQVGYNPN